MVKFAVEFWWKMLLTILPSKRSSRTSFQTSPEVRHQLRRKLRQLHSGNRWCLLSGFSNAQTQNAEFVERTWPERHPWPQLLREAFKSQAIVARRCLNASILQLKALNRAELKMTHLRWRSPICGFLRKSAVFCGFLCPPNAWISRRRRENLRKSAVFCDNLRFGLSLSP